MTDRRCYDVKKRELSLLRIGDDGHLNGCERLWLLYMVSEQLGSNVVGLGSDFFISVHWWALYQGDSFLQQKGGKRNQLKTIPNWQSSWKRTSRVLQTNQNYCPHS